MATPAELVIEAERRLLRPEVRADAAAVAELLDPGFREIGQSGRLWTRDAMVAALLGAGADELADARVSEETVTEPAAGLFLLTYRLDSETGATRRSSLWRVTDGRCRLLFHQGTQVPAERGSWW